MAEFIRLAQMPRGKTSKTLSIAEKEYIDENHKYEPSKKVRAKPKKMAKSETFDVEAYKTWTI